MVGHLIKYVSLKLVVNYRTFHDQGHVGRHEREVSQNPKDNFFIELGVTPPAISDGIMEWSTSMKQSSAITIWKGPIIYFEITSYEIRGIRDS